MDMNMMLKPVEDQILADDDHDSVTMDRATADTLVSIAESVLICEVLSEDDGELLTVEILQPKDNSWNELDRLLSAMHIIRWQHYDDDEYNTTKYNDMKTAEYKSTLNRSYGLSAKYPHIARMLKEHNDLLIRIAKLDNYYEDHIHELTTQQCKLMGRQLTAMRAYADVLADRIKYDVKYYSKK